MADSAWDVVSEKPATGAAVAPGQGSPWDVVTEKPAPAPVNPIADAAGGYWTGLQEGVSAIPGVIGDAVNLGSQAGTALVKAGAHALGVPDAQLQGPAPNMAAAAHVPTSPDVNALRQKVQGVPDYQPQTVGGQYARKAGQLTPNAVLPGSAPARIASVVVPAVTGETARLGAQALGGDENAQNVADAVGTIAGGVGANVRLQAPKGQPVAVPHIPTLDELTAQKNAAYQAVDKAGIQYAPSAVDGLIANVKTNTQSALIDPDLHPQATAIVKRIDGLQGQPISLPQLDQIRRLNRDNVIASPSKDQRRIGYVIQDAIDGMIANAQPGDLVGGTDPQTAAATLNEARDLNSRVAKMESVQSASDRAQAQARVTGSGGNVDNATRQKLNQLLQRSRGLSPDEQNAMAAAAAGSPVQNVLRQVGKVSPQGNGLMLAGHLGAAAVSHGSSLPIAVTGAVAKAVADGMTKANVQRVMDLMAVGGNDSSLQLAQMAQRDARVDNLVRQLNRVSINSSTVNALRGSPMSQGSAGAQPTP